MRRRKADNGLSPNGNMEAAVTLDTIDAKIDEIMKVLAQNVEVMRQNTDVTKKNTDVMTVHAGFMDYLRGSGYPLGMKLEDFKADVRVRLAGIEERLTALEAKRPGGTAAGKPLPKRR